MKAAFLAIDGAALWQVALLQKLLHDDGWVWRTVTLDGRPVHSDGGIALAADAGLTSVAPRDFDLLLIAGGEIQPTTVANAGLHRFLRQFDGQGGWIAASCSASVYLGAAGLLGGRRFAAERETVDEWLSVFSKSMLVDEDVCTDGNFITAKGMAHVEFTLEVCRRIGAKVDDQIP
ncbi:DJ-1/PfpI family protein [Alicyclobacillus sp. SO9]|uniref:DJ-1/PfpI family protein n=1 Tax=Alicyclobacillus sp. SO9 TaxID=2665646 RepID=UPI0018E8C1F0|nr:DJ-1/PfpI family protein [Alicyclobacillus sp. SO9]QQE80232.1 DJ-1/PfpI family protein [Alicyclobacillus sp. SO9]